MTNNVSPVSVLQPESDDLLSLPFQTRRNLGLKVSEDLHVISVAEGQQAALLGVRLGWKLVNITHGGSTSRLTKVRHSQAGEGEYDVVIILFFFFFPFSLPPVCVESRNLT